jgi:hypothetical protein
MKNVKFLVVVAEILTFLPRPEMRDALQRWTPLTFSPRVARRHQLNENSWLANAPSRFSE